MKVSAHFDTREIQRAFQEYAKATGKDEAEILNRAARNTVIKAYNLTKQAEGSRIKAYLTADNFRMAGIILTKRGKLKGLTRKQREAVIRRFVAASVRSVRYIKIGWARAGLAFGAFTNAKVNSKSEAAKGYGIKADPNKLIAEIANNSRGADKIALRPLQEALALTAADMARFAARELQKTANKYSG